TVADGNNGILDPGETSDFTVTIGNIGSANVDDISGELSCSDDRITINDPDGYFGNVNVEEEVINNVDRFNITAGTQIVPGSQIVLNLRLYNSEGYDFTVYFILEIGVVYVTDPLGSDAYGYYMYDDGDTDYGLAPMYSWIEIDPNFGGSGTDLNLYDPGNTGDIENVELHPDFNFVFYGESYSTITVCSNGWICPGGTDNYEFMNWHLPGPLGPSPMIAPFWDDLKTSTGRVCIYFDADFHFYIIEWSRMRNEYNNDYETFEVILYDPEYYPTASGDSNILFQYNEINNIDQGSYRIQHGQYATVGLEDSSSLIGLEYTYNNQYPTAAKPLENEMAILITTDSGLIMEPPVAIFSQDNFEIALLEGESDSLTLEITNMGEANLMYNISKVYIDSEEYRETRGNGGPDDYGYIWTDSNDPEGPEYIWRDISGLGTLIDFEHNDVGTDFIPLEFTFNYYGVDYTQFRINPNGWIGFGNDNEEWQNTAIPSSEAPRPAILGYWDDLRPFDGTEGGGDVYYYSTPDSLIVWFDNVIHYVGVNNGTYDFEMIIY
ncbi:MAG: hypothetical protein KAT74_12140, partial [Candidatus Cloacimonetes bacterium]|nr:hypothetical protein [Candidatus Cloacimonadota bacterium]